MSPLRHLYLIPVAWAALRGGARAGGLLGLMAGFFQVPLVLPAIERAGLTGAAVEGLVSLALPPAVGVIAGMLRDESRARARRLAALLEIEQCLAREAPLPVRLDGVAAVVRRGLKAARVGVLVGTTGEAPALGSARFSKRARTVLVRSPRRRFEGVVELRWRSGRRTGAWSVELPGPR